MTLSALRAKHPRFVYKSYSAMHEDGNVRVNFEFRLEPAGTGGPNITFTPEVTIPDSGLADFSKLENFVFHLGLIEAISYWKVACSPEFVVEAGNLTEEQITWWHDLFINGLGEFFYKNDIDFTAPDFLKIVPNSAKPILEPYSNPEAQGNLILVGGGKDSAVTLELLRNRHEHQQVLIVETITNHDITLQSTYDVASAGGFTTPLVVKRTIDLELLGLNNAGYLNGHTPFSAYLAFLGTLVAALGNYKSVIVSNERSAGEGNLVFHNLEINHQYSKSPEFEKLFRDYSKKYLSTSIEYFSFLRPIYDLQVSKLFTRFPQYHSKFKSCNAGQEENKWCGTCPKCAFVYISLFPFIPYERMIEIFGEDYYAKPQIQAHIHDLVGLSEHKPFECVGTEEEAKLAIALSIKRYQSEGKPIPPFLLTLQNDLDIKDETLVHTLEERVMNSWGEEHFLPPEYVQILKAALTKTGHV